MSNANAPAIKRVLEPNTGTGPVGRDWPQAGKHFKARDSCRTPAADS